MGRSIITSHPTMCPVLPVASSNLGVMMMMMMTMMVVVVMMLVMMMVMMIMCDHM